MILPALWVPIVHAATLASRLPSPEPIAVSVEEPAVVVLEGKPRTIVAIRCLPMPTEYGGAMDVGAVLRQPERHKSLSAHPFWRDLVRRSVPSREAFAWMGCRVAIDLDDGRRIIVDHEACFVVVPTSLQTIEGWKGLVRELTGPQATRMVCESLRLSPPDVSSSLPNR